MAKASRRVTTEPELAAVFGVSDRQVRNWKRAAWWRPEFQTASGYDVEAIRAAYSENKAGDEYTEQRRLLKLHRERAELEIKLTELRAKERAEQRELANLLPADVYAEYHREVLGMIRAALEELPQRFAKECPPKLRAVVWVDPRKVKRERDAGKLQRMVAKLIGDIEEWLNSDPVEETTK